MLKTELNNNFGVNYNDKNKVFKGYTLFTPLFGATSLLLDMNGNIVHKWSFNKRPSDFAYLLSNGNILYPERLPLKELPVLGGCGCDCLEVDWNNNLVNKYTNILQHHVVRKLRNGNLMFPTYIRVPKSLHKKIKGGRPNTEDNGNIYCDSIIEVTWDGEVVWEWKSYENLDLEFFANCPLEERYDWNHCNTCVELPDGDILISLRSLDSLAIIDKKSKKLKWHWGRGELKHPHMASYLENGNILCFDNGTHRGNCFLSYSRVVEVNPNNNEIVWEYIDNSPLYFYSGVISGAQRLPNGNTLITEGCTGRIFEVNMEKEIVWQYKSPFYYDTGMETIPGLQNWIHRAYRYSEDFTGFNGKKLNHAKYKELNLIFGAGAF